MQHTGPSKKRGFASMSVQRLRQISRKGGQISQRRGTAHQWTVEEARVAGQKSASLARLRRSTETNASEKEGPMPQVFHQSQQHVCLPDDTG